MTRVDDSGVVAERTGSTPRSETYAWSVVGALSLAYLLSILDRYLISITLEPLKADLKLSDTQLGLLSGPAFALLYAFFCPVMGRLSDTRNRCLLIAGGMLVWSLSTGAVAFSDTFEHLLVSRALVGVGEACLVPAGTSLIAAYFAREQLGRATGVFLAGASVGKAVAFIGGGALLATLTAAGGMYLGRHFTAWQALFIMAALPGVALACVFPFLRDPGHGDTAPAPGSAGLFEHLRTRKAAYALHIAGATVVVMASSVFLSWSPSFYARRFHLSPSDAAMIAGVATVVSGPLGYLLGGAAMDRMRRRGVIASPTWIIGLSLVLAIPSCALFTQADRLWLSVVGYGFAQLAAQMPGAAAVVGIQFMTPLRHRGAMVGVYMVIVTLGSLGIGPALIGVINDRLFAGQSLGSSILMVVAGFSVLGVVASALNTRRFARAVVDD
jgi:MFS family permease